MDSFAPIRWEGLEVCDVTRENFDHLRLVLAATTLLAVVPLLGGVAEVCHHLILCAWVVISG